MLNNMAAAKPSVDSAVNERRLRPIYECLDNGNNKKALQEAAKLLKKQENFMCAKVLKALALIRLGRPNESISILQEVHIECPADEATLQAMTICYWELHKPELIAEAYENASKKDPCNEEFLTHLFMAHVRLGHYKKQQLTAMTLYKVKPKNPYYFWAVMSVVMQAHSSDDQLAKNMFLPLAQKMTEKLVNEGKIEAEAEVELYLEILTLQGKFEEALAVINGPMSEHLKTCTILPQRKASLLEKLQKWNEANAAFKNLLISSPDDWCSYQGYFNSLFKIMAENSQFESIRKDWLSNNRACEASSFILKQINEEKSQNLRGPFLARLEFLKEMQVHGNDSKGEEQLAGTFPLLLLNYFEKFGSKMCCFGDLKPYIDHSSEADKKKFLELLEKKCDSFKDGEKQFPSNPKELQLHIGYVQICRYLGQHSQISMTQKFDLVDDLIQRYQSSFKFKNDLPETDVHPGSDYCILAVHVLIDLWKQTGNDNILLEAITCLEWGLVHSPLNHQFKFLLIKLYHKIGAIVPAYHFFNSMDIKHIQLDTVGYVLFFLTICNASFVDKRQVELDNFWPVKDSSYDTIEQLPNFRNCSAKFVGSEKYFITRYLTTFTYYSVACTVYGNTLRFFTSNYKEIYEFIKFRDRLNNSQQCGMVTIERMILDLVVDTHCHEATEQVVHFMGVEPEKEKVSLKSLIDNRDLNVMSSWDICDKELLKQTSCNDEVNWLKLRQLLVRALTAGVLLSRSHNNHKTALNDEITNGVDCEINNTFQIIVDDFTSHVRTLDATTVNAEWSLTGPYESRILLYLRDDHPSVILESLNLLLYLKNISEKKINENSNEQPTCLELPSRIQLLTNQCINKVGSIKCSIEWPMLYEALSNLVETLSLLLITFGCCQRILKPIKTLLLKKGKKKNKEYVPSNASDLIKLYENNITAIDQCFKELNQLISRLKTDKLAEQFSSLKISIGKKNSIEDLSSISNSVQEKICKSYQTSLKEFGDLIQHKIKYLGTIKL
ncbi:N-alpha-acetyltransferase 25, NatB auxiliary subunit [Nymphon striatum]|nr:N-alpha-acetyltransferase 25, NatB auxiliary subunit [Nymphon striatum]